MSEKKHDQDVAFIRALAELLRENDLTELQVKRDYGEDDSLNVRVSRMQPALPAPTAFAAPATPAPAQQSAPAAAPASDGGEDPASHPGAVSSPMVGTVYLQPEPGSAPFALYTPLKYITKETLNPSSCWTLDQLKASGG